MAVTGPWLLGVINGWFTGKTVKVMLVTSAYTQDVDSASLPTSFQVSGTGYTAGGVTVTGVAVAYDSATDTVRVTCSDVAFGTVTLPDVGGAVIYSGTQVIAADVFSPIAVAGVPFTYVPSAAGLVTGTIA